jgi:predicted ATP-grasp superfamily ATP-dependent carboligase
MTEPAITLEIRLTESLTAPLIAATRQQFEKQLKRVMGATVGMYGDLQGITGKLLQEIEGLDFPALEASNITPKTQNGDK